MRLAAHSYVYLQYDERYGDGFGDAASPADSCTPAAAAPGKGRSGLICCTLFPFVTFVMTCPLLRCACCRPRCLSFGLWMLPTRPENEEGA